ncbi:hypothetical protein GF420_02950 [candidate division GN15 bacterium]|nr:hypothetical protein [candidate division GN15 bacterium]
MLRTSLIFALLTLLVAGSTLALERDLVVRVETAPNPWAENGLEGAIVSQFTRDHNLRVSTVAEDDPRYPQFPSTPFDLDSLTNWGMEIGGRFLLTFVTESQRIDRRKSFHLPLVFHKWETVGVLAGEVRLIDLRRGRLLAAESFVAELPAKRVFQGTMDDNKYDPDIHLTPSEKTLLFRSLYELAAERLYEMVKPFLGGR